ncbi:hypothetical protein [Microcoleus sp. FACHB-68]|nr:hypothetical protein [Microcoleus sp. FACHB-68]MBD1936293.1 hypothetical protein [Microcoleus sp. FACHB-68]
MREINVRLRSSGLGRYLPLQEAKDRIEDFHSRQLLQSFPNALFYR